ncbi:hypothetical protein TanjilG_13445 [Lupinus angustifolius]|uniref:DUF632 domain-containing protein n=1 Tax=Lupinus angustifolius TaxID=3871 RepID=A0A4P1RUF8_LUPAN|nr:hypothetical protein TanjilG_13445 [Lupinus angustifolius]
MDDENRGLRQSGERVRIACVKKSQQFKNHDVEGEDPSYVDKTKAAIRDLHTQITVSLHSVEAISKRYNEDIMLDDSEVIETTATGWRGSGFYEPDASKLACSPGRSSGTHPLFGLCVQWSRRLDAIQEAAVLDGIDFFPTSIGSFHAQQLREDSQGNLVGSKENMEMVEVVHVEEVMNNEKLAEVAIKVLCAGMSAAMSSMAEFAVGSAEGYNELAKQWEN